MNPYLILVKHSLPEIQENLPAKEWHLSDEGRTRVGALAERLIVYEPDVIFSSVEPKAIETAEIVAASLGMQFEVVEGLHEHDRTTTPYLSRGDFERLINEFFARPDELILGSETASEAHTRFAKAVDSILRSHQNQTIVIVSHGTVISLFVSRLTGVADMSLWSALGLPSFVVIDMQSNTLIGKENIA